MAVLPPVSDESRRTLSLEWKLPLVMTCGIAAALAALLFSAYFVLRQRSEGIWRDRLGHAIGEIARDVGGSLKQRRAQFAEVAQDESVRRVAAAPQSAATYDIAAARAALGHLMTLGDTAHPVELWNAHGRRILVVGPELPTGDRFSRIISDTAASAESPPDSVRFSPLEQSGSRVRFWAIAPVVVNRTPVGYIVQPRYVAEQREYVRTLREFMREDVDLYLRNANGSLWVAAPDSATTPPAQRDSSSRGMIHVRPNAIRMLAEEAPIAGAPWVAVIEASEASIMGPRVYGAIRLLAGLSVLVVLVGAVLSWIVGRRITRPLVQLAGAAESVSRGTYNPVVASGSDEIGRLAAAFDAMSKEMMAARSELEKRATEADTARQEAEEANRSKGDFLAMMSHELRTPLNAIGGYAQLLSMGVHGPLNDSQLNALERIDRNQSHLLTLITDLLSFARIDAGRIQYDIRDVAVHDVLANLETLIAPQLQSRALKFTYRPCPTGVHVRADTDRLSQILLNLLGNAIKYTPDGGAVLLACDFDSSRVRVHVRDTGRGIPADRLTYIFEPFVQGERALNRPDDGVGLGLAISRELATAMHGELMVQSELGRGSMFTLVLPRADSPAPTAGSRDSEREPRAEATV
jgi:signal transduction histidine kinase